MTNKEAISNLERIYGIVSPDIQISLDLAIKALEDRPTVEWEKVTEAHEDIGYDRGFRDGYAQAVEERPTGEWEKTFPHNGKQHHKCTNCHVSSQVILVNNFCPNCGAKMKEKKHD